MLSYHKLKDRPRDFLAATGLIGIGGGLTTSPLPHHRTFGSRIRRFGRFSMLAHAKALACHSPRQPHARSGTLSCKRLVMSLYDRSGLRRTIGAPVESEEVEL